jgi:hypothetical protein
MFEHLLLGMAYQEYGSHGEVIVSSCRAILVDLECDSLIHMPYAYR